MTSDCRFCKVDEDADQKILFENTLVLFVSNPKLVGSLKHSGVIVPRQHRETVFDLSPEEISATFDLLKEVKNWMALEFKPAGYNIGWNCYEVGGQTDMHAHMHVIPRFKQEPLAGKGIRSLLKSEANRW